MLVSEKLREDLTALSELKGEEHAARVTPTAIVDSIADVPDLLARIFPGSSC